MDDLLLSADVECRETSGGRSALCLVDIILVREKSLESLEIFGRQLEVRVT